MEVTESFTVSESLLKIVFFFLIGYSLVRNVYEMYAVNRLVDGSVSEVKKQPTDRQKEVKWEKLLMNLSQDDLELVGKLKSEVVAPANGRYNFRKGDRPFKEHVLERAVRQLNLLHRGYFVEVGAGDGEARSPTVCLEIEDKWHGLLIEADPRFWSELKSKRRKVSLGLNCVGFTNSSYTGKLGLREPTRSRLIERWEDGLSELVELSCYPLYTYLLAVDRQVVHFLVININGQEVEVLRTLPWDKITIHIIAVCYGTKKERIELNEYLATKGYHIYRKYHQDGESFLMFVKFHILR